MSPSILATAVLCSIMAVPVHRAMACNVDADASIKEAPDIEQFLRIRAPNSPTLAVDGSLYVRDWPDGINQLYRRTNAFDLDGEWQRLTDFEDGLSSYAVSPDGRHIILSAAIGGSEQNDLFHLDPETGEITTIVESPAVLYRFNIWLRDSSGFIYAANDVSPRDMYLYRYDLESGESTLLSDRPGSWSSSDVTDDGTRMLIMHYTSVARADIYELDTRTGETKPLNISDEHFNAALGYLPDERHVAIVSDAGEDGFRRLYVRNLQTGRTTRPLPDLHQNEFEAWHQSIDRSKVAVRFNDDGYSQMRVYRLPGFERVPLPELDRGMFNNLDIINGTLIFTLSNARTPGLTFAVDLSDPAPRSDTPVRQLTVADDQGIDLARFRLPDLITYETFDGLETPAFLYLPPDYEEGRPIPFVAHYHGGPESQFRPWFTPAVQYLIASGYGVIQPNVRGSTGYGREFHQMDNYHGRWDSVRDGVYAVRWLIDNGYAEPGRVAAYGGSYGGFMSVATVIEGQELYGASINNVGIVNFITFLEQTADYRRHLREAEYGPLTDREFLKSISPINMIDRINVPMMISHGLNDPRVPVGEAMQLAVGLQRRGFDPELLFFPDEGHGLAKLDNRLLFWRRAVRFLDRTIGHGGEESARRPHIPAAHHHHPPPTIPLFEAVHQNDLAQIRSHIEHGSNLNVLTRDETGGRFAPLHVAARIGSVEAARLLVEAGADVNIRADAPHRATPLHWAARANQLEFARLLVENGAEINAPAGVGNDLTPRRTAADRGYHQVAEFLRERGGRMTTENR